MNKEIVEAVKNIKSAILKSQSQIALNGNRIQLSLYFGIGKYISENTRNNYWGTGAIENISSQLQKEMPGLRGFSTTNLKNMRTFFEEWNNELNRQSVTDDLQQSESEKISSELLVQTKKIEMHEFLSISFTHHIEIITKTKSFEERKFYIHQTFVQHWDSRTLKLKIKNDLFNNQHLIPNNFEKTISDDSQSIKAIHMFKDEYLLDFMNTEELTARFGDVNEHTKKDFVEYAIRDYTKPIGVATYKTLDEMPEKYRKVLPDLSEMRKFLGGEQK